MASVLLQENGFALLQEDGFYILLSDGITSRGNAKFDENGRPTIICASDADGVSIVVLQADPTSHRLQGDDDTVGSDNGNNSGNAMLDENSVHVWTALSSANDGTIVEVYADPNTGKVLIDSN